MDWSGRGATASGFARCSQRLVNIPKNVVDMLNTDRHPHHIGQYAGLNLLAVAHMALGDLGRVRRVVKVLGMVNGIPTFADHPKVINGCSDLFVNVFGEVGKHARSAVGMASLPGNISVEIEAILQVDG